MKKLLPIICMVLVSCGTHPKSNITANEEFLVELKGPSTRGGLIETALEGLFLGAKFFADKSSKSLTSNYSHTISINNYYNTDLGYVEKTYDKIVIKKYSNPEKPTQKEVLSKMVENDFKSIPKSRGNSASLSFKDIFREQKDDLLNFYAVIELESKEDNPGVTRLKFSDLRVFFSKTRVFNDENLNAQISILLEGQWRGEDGSPIKATLIEQEYDFKNLKYGMDNQIEEPLLSDWYYDIPINPDIEDLDNYGVFKVNIQLKEYEGNKSKYINKLPSILSDNKDAIIKNGASTIQNLGN